MFNEVDRVRLDMLVECSYCQSKDVKCTSFCTTIMTAGEFDAPDGHHEHDTNRIRAYYTCANGHKFEITPINSCWCGWKQQ